MSELSKELGVIADPQTQKALFADEPGGHVDFDLALAAGKLLRAEALTPEQRKVLRARIRVWQNPDDAWQDVREGFDDREEMSFALIERLGAQARQGGAAGELDLGDVFSLLLLRDDIEAIALSAAVASHVPPTYVGGPVLERLRVDVIASCRSLDEQAASLIEVLRAPLSRFDDDPPDELRVVLADSGNPWWLDLIDPVMRAVRKTAARPQLVRLAAAAIKPGESRPLKFNGGYEVSLSVRHDGILQATLVAEPSEQLRDLELSWVTDDGIEAARFELNAETRLLICAPAESLLEAESVALRRGAEIWVRE